MTIKILSRILVAKEAAGDPQVITLREQLVVTTNVMMDCAQVGYTHICYVLMGLAFSKMSRKVKTVNPLPSEKLYKRVITNIQALENLPDDEPAYEEGLSSPQGLRNAYDIFCKQQHALNPALPRNKRISFFIFLTNFNLKKSSESRKKKLPVPLLLSMDEATGCRLPSAKFEMSGIVFNHYPKGKEIVLRLSPNIKLNLKNIDSCHAYLLLHLPWANMGEAGLLLGKLNAVEAMTFAIERKMFPDYVEVALRKIAESEGLYDPVLAPQGEDDNEDEDDDDNIDNDEIDVFEDSDEEEKKNDNDNDKGEDELHNNEEESSIEDSAGSDTSFSSSEDTDDDSADVEILDPDAVQRLVISNINYDSFLQDKSLMVTAEEGRENVKSSNNNEELHNDNDDDDDDLRDYENMINGEGSSFEAYPSHDSMKIELKEGIALCNPEQLHAMKCFGNALKNTEADIASDPTKQMIEFITGPGGSGKSFLINLMRLQAKIEIGKTKGRNGPIMVMAPTNASAAVVNGKTFQSQILRGLLYTKPTVKGTDLSAADATGTRVLIFDEISLEGEFAHYAIDRNLKLIRLAIAAKCLNENSRAMHIALSVLPFGGFIIVFIGDFYQLKCVGDRPVYFNLDTALDRHSKEITDRLVCEKLGHEAWRSINTFVELFKNMRILDGDESVLARVLDSGRVGKIPSATDIAFINANCLMLSEEAIKEKYDSLNCSPTYVAYTNKVVDRHNQINFRNLTKGKAGVYKLRGIAKHRIGNITSDGRLSEGILKQLLRKPKDMQGINPLGPPELNLCVGQRVVLNCKSYIIFFN